MRDHPDRGEMVVMRIGLLFVASLTIAGCSGTIHNQSVIGGRDPVSLTVDARQRVLLSQYDPGVPVVPGAAKDPLFRRFCAEPSPDVFTVLGVGASGGASFTQDTKGVSAALQAALSSSETGTTISRTQTINMLREMMFRTCERYLSGAISRADFPIIAARDQRVMVSILAIEQLTGAITPPAVAISASGEGSTGMNATEMVKLLATKQEDLASAQGDLDKANKTLSAADTAAATCDTLTAKKAVGTPALTADETTKLKACDDGRLGVAKTTAARDLAQAQYDDLVAASKKGLGVSSARSGGSVDFADSKARSEAVITVANTVENIVNNTFRQDETQLFCFRTLTDPAIAAALGPVQTQCLNYLTTKVATDEKALADRYGVPVANVQAAIRKGTDLRIVRTANSQKLNRCFTDAGRADRARQALGANPGLAAQADALIAAGRTSADAMARYLFDMGETAEYQAYDSLTTICGLGDGA
ncbi:hypothetical protein [Sphingomonas endophytica]|nr:hypothetical protein [Sphingomonas endophytica]